MIWKNDFRVNCNNGIRDKVSIYRIDSCNDTQSSKCIIHFPIYYVPVSLPIR